MIESATVLTKDQRQLIYSVLLQKAESLSQSEYQELKDEANEINRILDLIWSDEILVLHVNGDK